MSAESMKDDQHFEFSSEFENETKINLKPYSLAKEV